LQVLDVLLFGVLKRAKKNQSREDELPAQVDHALRFFRAYEQATTSTAVRASWDNNRHLTINQAAIRSSKVFREPQGFDHVLDRLFARRKAQKRAWINQHVFRKREVCSLKHSHLITKSQNSREDTYSNPLFK
jgi:hypothetical protein